MKRIYHIELFRHLEKVHFYSLRIEDEEENITDEFFDFFAPDKTVQWSLKEIVDTIEQIGRRGAQPSLFRPEREADALPPKFVRDIEKKRLRLYCIRLRTDCVLLLSGCRKTDNDPEKCKNCNRHFKFANNVAKEINRLIKEKDIQFTGKGKMCFTYESTIEI